MRRVRDRLKSASGTARLLKSPSVRAIMGESLIIEISILSRGLATSRLALA